MTFSSDDDIAYITNGLITRTLPKPEWTHAAHFAAAIGLLADPNYNAFQDMPGFIKAYNVSTGGENTDDEGYHETITQASLMAAQYVLKTHGKEAPLYECVNDLLSQEFGKPGWLFSYWSKDVLFSVKARKSWVAPDIKALPF